MAKKKGKLKKEQTRKDVIEIILLTISTAATVALAIITAIKS